MNLVKSRATVQGAYFGGKKCWDTYVSKASYGVSHKNNLGTRKERRAAE